MDMINFILACDWQSDLVFIMQRYSQCSNVSLCEYSTLWYCV